MVEAVKIDSELLNRIDLLNRIERMTLKMKEKRSNKKRNTMIVMSSLLILIILAIAIIWIFAKPQISTFPELDEEIASNFTIVPQSVLITSDGNITFQIKRSEGGGNVAGFYIILENAEGEYVQIRKNLTIFEFETATIKINNTEYSLSGNLTKISIVPILLDKEGNELTNIEGAASSSDSYLIKEEDRETPKKADRTGGSVGGGGGSGGGGSSVSPPSAPSNLTANSSSASSISLKWQDNSNNEDGFYLERDTNSTFNGSTTITLAAGLTDYTNFGLDNLTTYFYRIKAYNSGGNSSYSNTANATTATCTDGALPCSPTDLAATVVSTSKINLTWSDQSNNETGFYLERSTSSSFTSITTFSPGVNTTFYNDTGLTNGATYYYRVKAYSSGGNSSYSNTESITPGCTYTITPSSIYRNTSSGVTVEDAINITTESGCAWSIFDNVNWLDVSTSGGDSSGTGNATFLYTVTLNKDYTNRTGIITIGGKPFNLTQDAARVEFSVSATYAGTTALESSSLYNATENSINFGPVIKGSVHIPIIFTLTNPGGGNASDVNVTFTNPSFGFKNGTYPGEGGTCGNPIKRNSACNIVISHINTSQIANHTGQFILNYTDGPVGNRTNKTFSFNLNASVFSPTAENVLIVYNANNTDSVNVTDYYTANRPGIGNASVLGLNLSWNNYIDRIANATFVSEIRTPIVNWLNNSNKSIYYIVMMYGMPTRINMGVNPYNIPHNLNRALKDDGYRNGSVYNDITGSSSLSGMSTVSGFTTAAYPGTTALISYMDMGSVNATKAYIDKLNRTYWNMSSPDVVISAKNANLSGSRYYIDDAGIVGLDISIAPGHKVRDEILYANSSTLVNYTNGSGANHFVGYISNVSGYRTWGQHAGQGDTYATDGTINFTGNSGWYAIDTVESYNGMIKSSQTTAQGSFVDWFSKNAFGSSNYENTPALAAGYSDEPGVVTNAQRRMMAAWESGYLSSEAVWFSRSNDNTVHFGDPLIRK